MWDRWSEEVLRSQTSQIYFYALRILLGIFWLPSLTAFAQTQTSRPDILAIKTRLEDQLSKRFKDKISTQVAPELFNVGVQITIDYSATVDAQNKNVKTSELPEDITLGVIDHASELPLSEATSDLMQKIKVRKVEVLVGLSTRLGEDYRAKLSTWLTGQVKAEFGGLGTSKVSLLAEVPPEPEKVKAKPTFEERFGNVQNFVGLLVFGLFLVLAVLLIKLIPSRDMKEQLAINLKIHEMKNSEMLISAPRMPLAPAATPAARDVTATSITAVTTGDGMGANFAFENYRDHQKKVAYLASSSASMIDRALDLWFEEGEDGRKKIACFVDGMITHFGAGQVKSTPSQDWVLPSRIKNDRDLPQVFRELASLSFADKGKLIERAYWDLLSIKTLGEAPQKTPFSGVAMLPPAKIQQLLSTQDKNTRSLTILHLPIEKMNQVVSEMSYEEKRQTLLSVIESPQVKANDIQLVDDSLKDVMKKQQSLVDGVIDLEEKLPNLLMCLSPMEEIQLALEMVAKSPDRGLHLKQAYPGLAFIPEWPAEKLKILFNGISSSELLAFIQLMPNTAELILQVLPPRMRTIVKDEIGKKEMLSDELNQNLELLRARVFKMVNEGQVILTSVFKDEQTKVA